MLTKLQRFLHLLFSREPRDRIRLDRRLREQPVVGPLYSGWKEWRAKRGQRSAGDYIAMQKQEYELLAAADAVKPGDIDGDYVVGSWREHDAWPDYETFLMREVPPDASWTAIEYGCGPGRNIRRWSARFARIDGVDISAKNLENARVFLKDLPAEKAPRLFVTQGMDCGEAPKGAYDFAFSTICLQHICVHTVRFSILRSLFECLKPGGRLSVQMGYGVPSPNTVPYLADHVQAHDTNRLCDVAIASPDEPKADLEKIGFTDFEYWLRPVGPGDCHPQWIFFTAVKPASA
jgi:SAM-dependent methyltransferase